MIDLSSLTNLTGLVEFRLMAIGTNSAAGGTTSSAGSFRVTNYFENSVNQNGFYVIGSVSAIPAPGAIALLGIAGALGTRRRR